jgi:hypothetical protein
MVFWQTKNYRSSCKKGKRGSILMPVLVSFLLILSGCRSNPAEKAKPEEGEEKIVGRAGDENLTFDEFNSNYVATQVVRDSAYNARKSIESWATESLFYQEALDKLSPEELDVEQQIENYRKSLINFAYQSRLIENNLDTVVSNEELQAYYEENSENFILKENIVKVDYIKVPLKAAGLEKIRKLVGSSKPKDQELLLTLCLQNAENFFMNDSTWLFVDDIKKEIPQLQDDNSYALVQGRVLEFTDDGYYYYLKINDVKIKNALSPLTFERANIRKYILNRRKTQLINGYKKALLERARAEKTFVIY